MKEDIQDAIAIIKGLWVAVRSNRPFRAFISLVIASFADAAHDAWQLGHLDTSTAGLWRMFVAAVVFAVWTDVHLCTPAPAKKQ